MITDYLEQKLQKLIHHRNLVGEIMANYQAAYESRKAEWDELNREIVEFEKLILKLKNDEMD